MPITMTMTKPKTMITMMLILVMVVGWGGGLPREKSREVLEQPREYLLKQEDSS
jgi:hypothetical protein